MDGKEKRLSLGVFPEISLSDARERREESRKLVAKGIDPSAKRKAEKDLRSSNGANTFEVIAREWWTKRISAWSEVHAENVIARLEKNIFPWLGNHPIAEISAPELLEVVRKVEDRGAIETAHRTLGICGSVFRYGIATGRAERDVAADLRGALPRIGNSTGLFAIGVRYRRQWLSAALYAVLVREPKGRRVSHTDMRF